jgi:hypothetical protein
LEFLLISVAPHPVVEAVGLEAQRQSVQIFLLKSVVVMAELLKLAKEKCSLLAQPLH